MIQLNGENFTVLDHRWGSEVYFDMSKWLEENGGFLSVRGGYELFGICPLEVQPLFILRFTR